MIEDMSIRLEEKLLKKIEKLYKSKGIKESDYSLPSVTQILDDFPSTHPDRVEIVQGVKLFQRLIEAHRVQKAKEKKRMQEALKEQERTILLPSQLLDIRRSRRS